MVQPGKRIMATQYQKAVAGEITPEMQQVAKREKLPPEQIRDEIAAGRLVIPSNRIHLKGNDETGVKLAPIGIGRAVTVKINANIGASGYGEVLHRACTGYRKNNKDVYSSSGNADYDFDMNFQPYRGIKTQKEFYVRPDFYYEPRKVIFGCSISFSQNLSLIHI